MLNIYTSTEDDNVQIIVISNSSESANVAANKYFKLKGIHGIPKRLPFADAKYCFDDDATVIGLTKYHG